MSQLEIPKNIPIIPTKTCSSGCCGSDTAIDEAQIQSGNHEHNHTSVPSNWQLYFPPIISFVLLILGIAIEYVLQWNFFSGWVKVLWYAVAYLPVGLPVWKAAYEAARNGAIFTEFSLMGIATIGAFGIGEYPEGVAVMLFYTIGELFQGAAVKRAKGNIQALLDVRPKIANVWREGKYQEVHPEDVKIGEQIEVKVGERVPLDGYLLTEKAVFNTAALTGESKPQTVRQGEQVFSGAINLEGVIEVTVTKGYKDSSIARILDMVQDATARKSKTELLIRRLAKVYTPIVAYLAMAICLLPYFFVETYVFSDWLYRALVFLVISCPCALVISIPLGYFGGLGAASKNGLLFKGATYLDQLTQINTLVMDKTGTLTKGVFTIQQIVVADSSNWSEVAFMQVLIAMESKSNHPIAKAIQVYSSNNYKISATPTGFADNCFDKNANLKATEIQEIAGKGLKGNIGGKEILVGNQRLLEQFDISTPPMLDSVVETMVLVAVDGKYIGHVIISDELKEDVKEGLERIRKAGVKHTVILSGDKQSITQKVAKELGIETAKGNLLPEDKLKELEAIQNDTSKTVAFVGDGINDAPVLALSDVGIAMGGLGSDVAIETADVVIQTDQPSKIATAIQIAKSTQRIIWQNIVLAFGVKGGVLILGAMGLATMWAAVFADVGVALLAILNAVRLQGMKWD